MKVVSTSFVISIKAGLPNITGRMNATCSGANGTLPTRAGCLNAAGTGVMLYGGGASAYVNNATISVNASQSSSLYSKSDTVTPLSQSTLMLMKY